MATLLGSQREQYCAILACRYIRKQSVLNYKVWHKRMRQPVPPGWEARLHGRQGCPPLRDVFWLVKGEAAAVKFLGDFT